MTGPGEMDRLTHQIYSLLLTCRRVFSHPIHQKHAAKVPRKRREACAKTQWAGTRAVYTRRSGYIRFSLTLVYTVR